MKLLITPAVTLLLLSLTSICAMAQVQGSDPQVIIGEILEEVLASGEGDGEVDPELLAQELILALENPVNINQATSEELERIFFLTRFQIQSLTDYIRTNGPLLSTYELNLVYGFDMNLISKLLPFITLEEAPPKPTGFPSLKRGKHNLMVRGRTLLEPRHGSSPEPSGQPGDRGYSGSKLGLYTRYAFTTRNGIQAGFVGEKDPGEDFFRGSNPYGFDHYTFHLQLTNMGRVSTLVVGDFNADFGQGLTLMTGASFGKAINPTELRRRPKGLYRYSSTDENSYLRGAGVTLRFGSLSLSAFGSYKYIDANIADTLINGTITFTSLPASGLHRTPSELASRKTLGEMVVGGNASMSRGNLRAGVTASLVNINGLQVPSDQPYKYFEPPLANRLNVGTDFSFALNNHMFFGEAAHTVGHGSGVVGGGLLRLHPLFKLSLLGRHYARDFSTRYTGAIAESSGPSNERGVLAGFSLLPYRYWEVKGYADLFSSPWLRFGVNAPTQGHDYMLDVNYQPRSTVNLGIRYRQKQKEENFAVDTAQARWVLPYTRQSLRFHLGTKPSGVLELNSRVELAWYLKEPNDLERGFMVYQDVRYQPQTVPLVLTARIAIFETDSWNTRIYAFENDVLYAFSIPAYYSRGMRTFLLVKYSVTKEVDVWVRVAQTYFANQSVVGSGLDRINAPTRSEVKVQVRVKL